MCRRSTYSRDVASLLKLLLLVYASEKAAASSMTHIRGAGGRTGADSPNASDKRHKAPASDSLCASTPQMTVMLGT